MADRQGFSINKNYAQKYENWRRKEELQKLKARYGDVAIDEEDESSSSEEDEDAEALTDQVEKDWLETLAALRRKDPKIYNKDVKFYHSDEEDDSSDAEDRKKKKKKEEKPMLLKDYERKVILEKDGKISDASDEEEMNESEEEDARQRQGYYEEQDDIKESFKSALVESGSESEDEFLLKRSKSKQEKDKEEKEFDEWRKTEEAKHYKSGDWTSSGFDDGEEFLKDYIINKRYIDRDSARIPTYDEIVNEEVDLSEEEENLEKEEDFERKFNFRFEEPDQEFIKSYPRTIGDSVRRRDSRRAEKRKDVKKRKLKEKDKKKEEIKQLKNLKKKEIMAKLDTIKEITGNKSLGISEHDLEGDFDPKEYDRLMQKAFDADFYGEDEQEKPVLPEEQEAELGLDVDDWDEWTGTGAEGGDWGEEGDEVCAGDPGFVMDADYDPNAPRQTEGGKKKKGKRKTKLYEVLEKDKPVFDPNEKTFEEYFDEYYKLDYEDIIGDLPCRFKYRQVVANDFGLSVDEILKARDCELNSWAALRKSTQYRSEEEERREAKIYAKRSRHEDKKFRILPSLLDEEEPISDQRKKKKKIFKNEEESSPRPSTSGEFFSRATALNKKTREEDPSDEIKVKSTNDGKRQAEQSPEVKKSKKQKASAEKSNVLLKDSPKVVTRKRKNSMSQEKSQENLQAESQEESQVKSVEKLQKKSQEKSQEELQEKLQKDTQKDTGESSEVTAATEANNGLKKKRKRKKKTKASNPPNSKGDQMTDERLKAYGFNPKTFKYIQRAKSQQMKSAS